MNNFTLQLIDTIYKITKRIPYNTIKKIGENIYKYKDNYILSLLDNLPIQGDYSLIPPKLFENKVWICWLQGEESAPDIVKKCIASVRKNCKDFEVIVLTENNISEYVTLPSFVTEKYKKGVISKTHYSDVVRMNLIAQQGGLWVDSTIFMSKPLSKDYFKTDFFSLRNTSNPSHPFMTSYWTTYFFYASHNNIVIKHCATILNEYVKEYDYFIDYFLMDYAIKKTISDLSVEYLMKQLDIIGNNRWLLHQNANKVATEDLISKFKNDPIGIYKLTYKVTYHQSKNGLDTIYKKIVESADSIE